MRLHITFKNGDSLFTDVDCKDFGSAMTKLLTDKKEWLVTNDAMIKLEDIARVRRVEEKVTPDKLYMANILKINPFDVDMFIKSIEENIKPTYY